VHYICCHVLTRVGAGRTMGYHSIDVKYSLFA
jgi:hypothetical protein